MSDIFISYKREERPIARKLANALEKQGWKVWWDPELRAGERFDDVIEAALSETKCVIVMWSALAVTSQYVRDEASYALDHDKLVPVAIENVELPFRFRGIHTAQLIGWHGSSESPALQKLIEDVTSILGLPPAQEKAQRKAEQEQARVEARREAARERAAVDAERKADEDQDKAEGLGPVVEGAEEMQVMAKVMRKAMEAKAPAEARTTPHTSGRQPRSARIVLLGLALILVVPFFWWFFGLRNYQTRIQTSLRVGVPLDASFPGMPAALDEAVLPDSVDVGGGNLVKLQQITVEGSDIVPSLVSGRVDIALLTPFSYLALRTTKLDREFLLIADRQKKGSQTYRIGLIVPEQSHLTDVDDLAALLSDQATTHRLGYTDPIFAELLQSRGVDLSNANFVLIGDPFRDGVSALMGGHIDAFFFPSWAWDAFVADWREELRLLVFPDISVPFGPVVVSKDLWNFDERSTIALARSIGASAPARPEYTEGISALLGAASLGPDCPGAPREIGCLEVTIPNSDPLHLRSALSPGTRFDVIRIAGDSEGVLRVEGPPEGVPDTARLVEEEGGYRAYLDAPLPQNVGRLWAIPEGLSLAPDSFREGEAAQSGRQTDG